VTSIEADTRRADALAAGETFAALESSAASTPQGHVELTREILAWAARNYGDRLIVASNMQDAVLVKLGAEARPGVDVLFLETGYHFAETLVFKERLADQLDLNVVDLTGDHTVESQAEAFGPRLYERDPKA